MAELPIVGIGAWAGGLDAARTFLEGCPADSGMAYVLVVDPKQAMEAVESLRRPARMPVTRIDGRVQLRPNHVYLIPAGRGFTLAGGELRLAGSAGQCAAEGSAANAAHPEAAAHEPADRMSPRPGTDRTHAREALQAAIGEVPATGALRAINDELQAKNDELARANADLNNLLANTGIGLLFLDGELRVRRYAPSAAEVFNLIASEVGRPFADLTHTLQPHDLVADAEWVLRERVEIERELGSDDGRFYQVCLRPARSRGNEVDGVVLTIGDVTERHRNEEKTHAFARELARREAYTESIIATIREPMLILDAELRVVTASGAFYRDFRTTPEATERVLLHDLGEGQWGIPELERLLDDVLPRRSVVDEFEVRHDFGDGERVILLNARRLRQAEDAEPLILLAFEDATDRMRSAGVLAASEKKYRDLFNSIDEGFCILEMLYDDAGKPVDYGFLEVNPAFYRNTGLVDAVGKTVRELVPEQEQHWFDIYGKVAATGEAERFEQRGEGMSRWFDVYAFRVGQPEQRRVAVLFTDITRRKREEHALLRLASIVDSSDDAIISKDLDGVINTWNRSAEEMFGYTAAEAIGSPIISLIIPPDRVDEEQDILSKIARGEAIDHFETVRQRKDGSRVDVSVTISPLVVAGRIVGASKIARDISERKRAEGHRELLIHELNHRVKNTLASVQALAMQTFRGSALQLPLETFEARLMALSAAHDVLTRENWTGAGIREIVDNALAAWRPGVVPRIATGGPDLRLRPAAALALAMALHELATNAAKYGALSTRKGKVSVQWSVSAKAPPCFRLRWLERGGPRVPPPSRRGFGSRLIESGLAQDLGGTVKLEFNDPGVECTIEAPLDEIGEHGAAP